MLRTPVEAGTDFELIGWPSALPRSALLPPGNSVQWIARPRLLSRLGAAVEGAQATVICALPGSGKTALAADWARQLPIGEELVWLTLGPDDNRPGTFWGHLVAALLQHLPDRPDGPWPQTSGPIDPRLVDALADELLAWPASLTLVLDRFEFVADDDCREVARLLDATTDRLKLVVLTRRRPLLPIHRYRLEGRSSEVGQIDFRCSREEAAAILAAHDVRPAGAVVDALTRETEGWIAAVRLAAVALQDRGCLRPSEDDVLAALSPVGTPWGEYVRLEVLPTLAPEDRDVLQRCSVVRCPSPDLVAWLGDLASRIPVVQVEPDAPGSFRIHPQIRASLYSELRRDDQREVARLHRRVADWLCHQTWDSAGVAAAVAVAQAHRDLEGMPSDKATGRAVEAALHYLEGTARFRAGELEEASAQYAKTLVVCMRDDLGEQRLECLSMLAMVEAARGNLTRAQDLADLAIGTAPESELASRSYPAAAYLAHAWVATERQELSRAQMWLSRAGKTQVAREDAMLGSAVVLLRARLRQDRGDLSGARHAARSRPGPHSWLHGLIGDLESALIRTATGQSGLPSGAPRGAATSETDPRRAEDAQGGVQDVASAVCDIADPQVQTPTEQMRCLLDRAERHCFRGDDRTARALVVEALAVGEPEQIRRPFRHAGRRVHALLRADREIGVRMRWLVPPAASAQMTAREEGGSWSAEPTEPPVPLPVVDALTEREREVLRHLSDMLSTQEIAAAMFISVNTVRTHVRHILNKLSVGRRNEAVRRARQLGLV